MTTLATTDVHKRFEIAQQRYVGAIKKAATRYTSNDVIERRVSEEDMEQECLILLFEMCEKLPDDVESEAFYAKFASVLWKRVGRVIQHHKCVSRDFRAETTGEAFDIHMESLSSDFIDEEEDELFATLGGCSIAGRVEIQDLIEKASKQLDNYEIRLMKDLVNPCKETLESMERLAEEDDCRINCSEGLWPTKWLIQAHMDLFEIPSSTFYKAKRHINNVFAVLLDRKELLKV